MFPGSHALGRDVHEVLQTPARHVEGCMYRHRGIFALRCHLHVFCALPGYATPQLSPRCCIFRGKAKVDSNFADASTAFVFGHLYVHPAAY